MTIVAPPPIVGIYEAVSFAFPSGACHMPDATAAMPPCLLCRRHSSLPPAKMGFIRADGEIRLFMVCGDCGADNEAEIERKVVERISEPAPAVAAE